MTQKDSGTNKIQQKAAGGNAGPVTNPKQKFTPEQIESARRILGISENKLQLRVGEPNPEWSKYGLYTIPMLISNQEGNFIPSGRKFVMRANKTGPELVADLGEDYELYPNERLREDLDAWASKNGYETVKGRSFNTRSGNGMILCYVPSKGLYKHGGQNVEAWRFAEKQEVKVGFNVRNSIDGSMGFGIGGFTFRMACDNGVLISANLGVGKLNARHVPSIREVLAHLEDHLNSIQQLGLDVIRYYRDLSLVKMNQKLVDALIASRVPEKYLTTPSKEKSATVCTVEKSGKDLTVKFDSTQTLWDAYNVLSDNIWHDDKADIKTKDFYYTEMHKQFLAAAPVQFARRVT